MVSIFLSFETFLILQFILFNISANENHDIPVLTVTCLYLERLCSLSPGFLVCSVSHVILFHKVQLIIIIYHYSV